MCRSVPQMAVESTLQRTSIGPGRGVGISSRTSCVLGPVRTTARMRVGRGSPAVLRSDWVIAMSPRFLMQAPPAPQSWGEQERGRLLPSSVSVRDAEGAAASHDAGGGGVGVVLAWLGAGGCAALYAGLVEVEEGGDAANAALAADPAPREGSDGDAHARDLGHLAAEVFEHADVA